MNDFGIQLTIALNLMANFIGRILLFPVGLLPEMVGAIAVTSVTGILMLIGFKYTSHQKKIKTIRNQIKAELLALSLFKDSVTVSLFSQGKILLGALQSILVSLIPIACMIIPVTLLLGQLSLWWQVRPLKVNEAAVLTLNLSGNEKSSWPEVALQPSSAVAFTVGPVAIRSKRAICWNIEAKEAGYHRLVFDVDGQKIEKEFAIGSGPMRVSILRPGWNWSEILLHPAEVPFPSQSPVKSIEIQYPTSAEGVTGNHWWLMYWFLGSTIVAFCFRGVFNVNL